jgi:hypothetical protein
MFILAASFARGKGLLAIVYLAAIALSVLAVDTVLLLRPVSVKSMPVRHPRAELLAVFLSFVIASAWLFSRFEGQ